MGIRTFFSVLVSFDVRVKLSFDPTKMHFHSSLILFFAFTFFASVQASPVHLELLNGRDNVYTVDVALPTENIAEPFPTEIANLVELPERRNPIAGPPSAGW